MKSFKRKLTAVVTGAMLLCSAVSAPSANALIIGEYYGKVPASFASSFKPIEGQNDGTFLFKGLSAQVSAEYLLKLTLAGEGDTRKMVTLQMQEFAVDGTMISKNDVELNVFPGESEYVYIDDKQSKKLTDYVAVKVVSEDANLKYDMEIVGLKQDALTKCVYTGRLDAEGKELDIEDPGTKPEYQLAFSGTPKTLYQKGDYADIKDYSIVLIAKTEFHTTYYDVSDYCYFDKAFLLDTVGDTVLPIKTSFRTLDGGSFGLELYLPVTVVESGTSDVTAPVVTTVSVPPELAKYVTAKVTCAYEDPDYSPWFTDEEGHTYNKGTNACGGYYLRIETKGRTEFAVGEELDTTGLKVFLVEDRTHNDVYYDVSDLLEITSDYDPYTPGEYEVSVFTYYAGNEGKAKEPVTYKVTVSESMTTGPQQSETGITFSEATTETTAVTTEQTPKAAPGDANGNGTLEVADNVVLTRYLTGSWTPSSEQTAYFAEACDLSKDKRINAKDLSLMKMQLLNKK